MLKEDNRTLLDMDEEPNTLEEIVLSWTVSTIRNEKPVRRIPEIFHSTREYFDSYKEPLIEETRSNVLSSLNSINRCQCYKLLSISEGQNFTYFLDIDPSCKDDFPYAARNDDLFLLSTYGPGDSLLDNDGIFALAVNISPHEYFRKSFHVMAKGDMTSTKFKFAIFICNIASNACVWRSLQFEVKNNSIIEQILKPPSTGRKCDICAKQENRSTLPHALVNNDLDRAQKDMAVLIASKIKCGHSQSVDILSGPPRSGKTKILSAVLEASKASEANILVCAPNISSFSALVSNMLESISRRPERSDVLPSARLGDVILLSDRKDEVESSNTQVQSFCIEYRIRKIMPCMTWKSRIDGLISFLEEGFKKKVEKIEDKLKEKTNGKNFIFRLLKEVVETKSDILMKLLKTLWIYLPSSIFSKEVETRIVALFISLEELKSLLQNEGVTDEVIRDTFKLRKAESFTSRRLKTSLCKPTRNKYVNVNPIVIDMRRAKDECLKCLKYIGRHSNLPNESSIESIRKFLIQKTSIILATPCNSFELHNMDGIQIDILFVEGASQIRECELLIPLSLHSLTHVILAGDSSQLNPVNVTKVNENSGIGQSLFGRLISLGFQKNILTKQHRTHPLISHITNNYFHVAGISNDSYVCPNTLNLELGNYAFINIDEKKEPSVIFSLLHIVKEAWKRQGGNLKVEVGILCSWTEIDQMEHMHYEHGQLNVTIQSIDKIQEEKDFDILILSTCGFSDDDDRKIKYALCRAREYLWIVGDQTVLDNYGRWKNLIKDARTQEYLVDAMRHPELFAIYDEKVVDMGILDILSSTLGLMASRPVRPAHEFTWVGRTCNGKHVLPPIRDQKGENHCTLCASLGALEFLIRLKCASLHPPIDCTVDLSLQKLLQEYNDKFIGIGDEEGDNNKGVVRLENVLNLIQNKGAISLPDNKVHMISSYARIYDAQEHGPEILEVTVEQLREGNTFVGTFKLSQNYIYYGPGDVYKYNPDLPILTPLTNKPASHAVMVVGGTETGGGIPLLPLEDRHLVMQNSHGEYFGEKGIGRVNGSSIRYMYKIVL